MEELKRLITTPPVLINRESGLPTRVTTDASDTGVGAILEQQYGEDWKPVAFWSRKLKGAEINYCATDKEWLAVKLAVTKVWRHWLADQEFEIRTDYSALK